MKQLRLSFLMLSLTVGLLIIACCAETAAQNWSSFRGNHASGVADGSNPPTKWNAEKSVNIAWKTAIPGLGHSGPVVWGDHIFVTTAVNNNGQSKFVHGDTQTVESADDLSKHTWHVYCLDKQSGRILWDKTVYEGIPKVKRHVKASHANSTPATDGKYLIVL